MRRARLGLVGALLGLILAAGCGGELGSPPAHTERFDDARVEVRIRFERTSASRGIVVAEFRPTGSGIHLYGTDLPPDGIDGAGRPTLVTVVDPDWTSAMALSASPSTSLVDYPGFEEPFPVFPDGPVTLRQAVERTGSSDDGAIETTVTFMACTSTGLCYLPVEDHPMAVPTQ